MKRVPESVLWLVNENNASIFKSFSKVIQPETERERERERERESERERENENNILTST